MLTPKAIVSLLLFTAGCSRGEATPSAASKPIEAALEAPADAAPEPRAATPAVADEPRDAAAAASVEAPKRTAPVAQKAPRPQPRTVYVCPMHPDVVRDQPGDCPKCNMHLEPRPAAELRQAETQARLAALETGERR